MTGKRPEGPNSAEYYTAESSKDRKDAGEFQNSSHRRVVGGRVVITNDQAMPFKVVLRYGDGKATEHPFRTIREGEAFIRSEAPKTPERDEGREDPAGGRGH